LLVWGDEVKEPPIGTLVYEQGQYSLWPQYADDNWAISDWCRNIPEIRDSGIVKQGGLDDGLRQAMGRLEHKNFNLLTERL
jgi:hypothetical protein